MPQFTAPRPMLLPLRKPRNPLVAPSLQRRAGRHQDLKPRQKAQTELKQALRELGRPPSE
jgi:hypothetical protein